jgi:hypothetical protein
MLALNRFVALKEKTNISLPPELARELDKLLERAGAKRHWTVFSAAVLLLIELSKDELDYYTGTAGAADYGHPTFPDLIRRARSGELRRLAEQMAAAARLVESGDLGEPREGVEVEEKPAAVTKAKGKRKTG